MCAGTLTGGSARSSRALLACGEMYCEVAAHAEVATGALLQLMVGIFIDQQALQAVHLQLQELLVFVSCWQSLKGNNAVMQLLWAVCHHPAVGSCAVLPDGCCSCFFAECVRSAAASFIHCMLLQDLARWKTCSASVAVAGCRMICVGLPVSVLSDLIRWCSHH